MNTSRFAVNPRGCVALKGSFAFAAVLSVVTLFHVASFAQQPAVQPNQAKQQMVRMDAVKAKEWQALWEKRMLGELKGRPCDKEMAEEIGWLVAPILEGFYYGYVVTGDPKWADLLVDWTDTLIKRGVKEPDGYIGWPKLAAAGTKVDDLNDYYADSLLGEAMALRPVVMMSQEILKSPALKQKYGDKAASYIKLSEQIFEKWDKRGAWRTTQGGGIITVVYPFGIDQKTGKWTDGYEKRSAPESGFSHPDNKANATAGWLLAMFDVTQKPVYKERAEKWFRLMKSRMKLKGEGTYQIWNYWEPAGPWDYKPGGATKHWVGVHPNAGYYCVDVEGIVAAYEHGLVFDKNDMQRLIATALAEKRYWSALAPYDATIQQKFEAEHKPDSWGGLKLTPWYLRFQAPSK